MATAETTDPLLAALDNSGVNDHDQDVSEDERVYQVAAFMKVPGSTKDEKESNRGVVVGAIFCQDGKHAVSHMEESWPITEPQMIQGEMKTTFDGDLLTLENEEAVEAYVPKGTASVVGKINCDIYIGGKVRHNYEVEYEIGRQEDLNKFQIVVNSRWTIGESNPRRQRARVYVRAPEKANPSEGGPYLAILEKNLEWQQGVALKQMEDKGYALEGVKATPVYMLAGARKTKTVKDVCVDFTVMAPAADAKPFTVIANAYLPTGGRIQKPEGGFKGELRYSHVEVARMRDGGRHRCVTDAGTVVATAEHTEEAACKERVQRQATMQPTDDGRPRGGTRKESKNKWAEQLQGPQLAHKCRAPEGLLESWEREKVAKLGTDATICNRAFKMAAQHGHTTYTPEIATDCCKEFEDNGPLGCRGMKFPCMMLARMPMEAEPDRRKKARVSREPSPHRQDRGTPSALASNRFGALDLAAPSAMGGSSSADTNGNKIGQFPPRDRPGQGVNQYGSMMGEEEAMEQD